MKSFSEYITEITAPINTRAVFSDVEKVLLPFASKAGKPRDFERALSKLADKYLMEVSTQRSAQLDPENISVIGAYDWENDPEYDPEEGAYPIEIILVFSSKAKEISLPPGNVQEFARMISETIAHEWIHLEQARKRNFQITRGKKNYMHKVENVLLGSYLSRDDEIEAHAFNIANSLLDKFGSKHLSLRFLKSPKKGQLADHHFDLYLDTFGNQHAVTKRLYKKILFYMDIAIKGRE